MLWKASFFICWIAGQLPVQRTISCVLGGNQGGFTEAIPAGRQKPAPPEGKKGSRSQACVVEVSPHPTPIKETSEAPGAVTPTVGGARWSRQALWGCTLVSNTVLSALGCSKAGQAEALAPSRPTNKAPWTVRKPPQPIGPESREEHDLWGHHIWTSWKRSVRISGYRAAGVRKVLSVRRGTRLGKLPEARV
ncbi:unnamed protein product [Rangifer tarandus platyrhynchus]|uniref:Uncharacterized protein n=1 Tax=Rangifer tarandus platyrhynchus TaxID=3082113 RepID=A0ABN8Y939_RANTA|nr:unnamed protein product [Rangifer tarandus platyrhynchus]